MYIQGISTLLLDSFLCVFTLSDLSSHIVPSSKHQKQFCDTHIYMDGFLIKQCENFWEQYYFLCHYHTSLAQYYESISIISTSLKYQDFFLSLYIPVFTWYYRLVCLFGTALNSEIFLLQDMCHHISALFQSEGLWHCYLIGISQHTL